MTAVDSLLNSITFVVLTRSADICCIVIISVSSIFIDGELEGKMLVVIFILATTNLVAGNNGEKMQQLQL